MFFPRRLFYPSRYIHLLVWEAKLWACLTCKAGALRNKKQHFFSSWRRWDILLFHWDSDCWHGQIQTLFYVICRRCSLVLCLLRIMQERWDQFSRKLMQTDGKWRQGRNELEQTHAPIKLITFKCLFTAQSHLWWHKVENMWAHTVEVHILLWGICFIHHVVHDNMIWRVCKHTVLENKSVTTWNSGWRWETFVVRQ